VSFFFYFFIGFSFGICGANGTKDSRLTEEPILSIPAKNDITTSPFSLMLGLKIFLL